MLTIGVILGGLSVLIAAWLYYMAARRAMKHERRDILTSKALERYK